jgi:dihydrofolate reductase
MKLALVVAVAENGVIGADGDIPWHHPEDLARFKRRTVGHPVIMGRRTYESIVQRLGEPLPERLNIVLSTSDLDLPDGAEQAESLEAAIDRAEATGTDVAYVVGGETVYRQFLPLADRLVWTEVHDTYDGDTYFPSVDREAWTEVSREDAGEISFVVYERGAES